MIPALPDRLTADVFAVLADGVKKRFGLVDALAGATLTVPTGAVYLLAGSNGAGKTTLLKTLIGLVRPDAGSVRVLEREPDRDAVAIRARTGFCPDDVVHFGRRLPLSGLLAYHAGHYPSWDGQYAARLSAAFGLSLLRPCHTLSRSEIRRSSLVMALAHRPPLLLLDEPLAGLDPLMRDEVLGILSDHLAQFETTLLVAAHEASELAPLVSHVGVLRAGRFLLQTPLPELRESLRRYQVQLPASWSADPLLSAQVLHRIEAERELEWTLWGDEPQFIAAFEAAGAAVRSVSRLSLDDSIRVVLRGTRPAPDA